MLTKKQIELVKATVPVLREHGVALTSHFYKRMLSHNPELRQVFNMGHQRAGFQQQALAGAVLAYAENIENLQPLLGAVAHIANKHVSVGIRAEHYPIVGKHLFYQGSTGGGSYGRIIRCLGCRLLSTRRHPYRNREKHLRQKRSCRGRLDRLAVFQSFREVQADG